MRVTCGGARAGATAQRHWRAVEANDTSSRQPNTMRQHRRRRPCQLPCLAPDRPAALLPLRRPLDLPDEAVRRCYV